MENMIAEEHGDLLLATALEEIALSPTPSGITSARLRDRLVKRGLALNHDEERRLLAQVLAHPAVDTTILIGLNVAPLAGTNEEPVAGDSSAESSAGDKGSPLPLLRCIPSHALRRCVLNVPRDVDVTADQLLMLCLIGRRRQLGMPLRTLQTYFTFLSAQALRDSIEDLLFLGLLARHEVVVEISQAAAASDSSTGSANSSPKPLRAPVDCLYLPGYAPGKFVDPTERQQFIRDIALVRGVLAQSAEAIMPALEVAKALGWDGRELSRFLRRTASRAYNSEMSMEPSAANATADGASLGAGAGSWGSSRDSSIASACASPVFISRGFNADGTAQICLRLQPPLASSDSVHSLQSEAGSTVICTVGASSEPGDLGWLQTALNHLQTQSSAASSSIIAATADGNDLPAAAGSETSQPQTDSEKFAKGRPSRAASAGGKSRGAGRKAREAACPLGAALSDALDDPSLLDDIDWSAPLSSFTLLDGNGLIADVMHDVTGMNDTIDDEMEAEEADEAIGEATGDSEAGIIDRLAAAEEGSEAGGGSDADAPDDDEDDEDRDRRLSRAASSSSKAKGGRRGSTSLGGGGKGGFAVASGYQNSSMHSSWYARIKNLPAVYQSDEVPAPPALTLSFADALANEPVQENSRRRVTWTPDDDARLMSAFAWDKVHRERMYQERCKALLREYGPTAAVRTAALGDPDDATGSILRNVKVSWTGPSGACGVEQAVLSRRLKTILRGAGGRLAAVLSDVITRLRSELGVTLYTHGNVSLVGDGIGPVPTPTAAELPAAPRLTSQMLDNLRSNALAALPSIAAQVSAATASSSSSCSSASSSAIGFAMDDGDGAVERGGVFRQLPKKKSLGARFSSSSSGGGASSSAGAGVADSAISLAPAHSDGGDGSPITLDLPSGLSGLALARAVAAQSDASAWGPPGPQPSVLPHTALPVLVQPHSDVSAEGSDKLLSQLAKSTSAASSLNSSHGASGAAVDKVILLLLHASRLVGGGGDSDGGTSGDYDVSVAMSALLDDMGGSLENAKSDAGTALRLLQRVGWAAQLTRRQITSSLSSRPSGGGGGGKKGGRLLSAAAAAQSAGDNDAGDGASIAGGGDDASEDAGSVFTTTSRTPLVTSGPVYALSRAAMDPLMSVPPGMLEEYDSIELLASGAAAASSPPGGGPAAGSNGDGFSDKSVSSSVLAAVSSAVRSTQPLSLQREASGTDVAIISQALMAGAAATTTSHLTSSSPHVSVALQPAEQLANAATLQAQRAKLLSVVDRMRAEEGDRLNRRLKSLGSVVGGGSGAASSQSAATAGTKRPSASGDGGRGAKRARPGGDDDDEDAEEEEAIASFVAGAGGDEEDDGDEDEADMGSALRAVARMEQSANTSAKTAAKSGSSSKSSAAGDDDDYNEDGHVGAAGEGGKRAVGGGGASIGVLTLLERQQQERRVALLQYGHTLVKPASAACAVSSAPSDEAGASELPPDGVAGADVTDLTLEGYSSSVVTQRGSNRMAALSQLTASSNVPRRVRTADIEPVPELVVSVHTGYKTANPQAPLARTGIEALRSRAQAAADAVCGSSDAVDSLTSFIVSCGKDGASFPSLCAHLRSHVASLPEPWSAAPHLLQLLSLRMSLGDSNSSFSGLAIVRGRWSHLVVQSAHVRLYTLPPAAASSSSSSSSSSASARRRPLHAWSSLAGPGTRNTPHLRMLVRALLHQVTEAPGVTEAQLIRRFAVLAPTDLRILLRWMSRCGMLQPTYSLVATAAQNPSSSPSLPSFASLAGTTLLSGAVFVSAAIGSNLASSSGAGVEEVVQLWTRLAPEMAPESPTAALQPPESLCWGDALPIVGAVTCYYPQGNAHALLQACLKGLQQ